MAPGILFIPQPLPYVTQFLFQFDPSRAYTSLVSSPGSLSLFLRKEPGNKANASLLDYYDSRIVGYFVVGYFVTLLPMSSVLTFHMPFLSRTDCS